MGTFAVLFVLIIAVIFAWKSSRKHLKGEGDCCGGGNDSCSVKYLNQVIDRRSVDIGGIHCQHCKTKIKTAINQVSYLACREIDDHEAIIESNRMIDDQEIITIIEKTGYLVKKMEKM